MAVGTRSGTGTFRLLSLGGLILVESDSGACSLSDRLRMITEFSVVPKSRS
jgi:hypothetical protein